MKTWGVARGTATPITWPTRAVIVTAGRKPAPDLAVLTRRPRASIQVTAARAPRAVMSAAWASTARRADSVRTAVMRPARSTTAVRSRRQQGSPRVRGSGRWLVSACVQASAAKPSATATAGASAWSPSATG
jgi:hypothetical protein